MERINESPGNPGKITTTTESREDGTPLKPLIQYPPEPICSRCGNKPCLCNAAKRPQRQYQIAMEFAQDW